VAGADTRHEAWNGLENTGSIDTIKRHNSSHIVLKPHLERRSID